MDMPCFNCASLVKVNFKDNLMDLQCSHCAHVFCGVCGKEAHFPVECSEYQKWTDRSVAEHQSFYDWVEKRDAEFSQMFTTV